MTQNVFKPDIIFSLSDGFVWACWPSTNVSVKLGSHEIVTEMMWDFLSQGTLAERLEKRAATNK